MNKTLTLLALVVATAATSFAGSPIADTKKVVVPAMESYLFNANEWQVDAFAAGAAGSYNHKNLSALGGGLGATYFFTRYFGIGIDDSLGGEVGGRNTTVSGALDNLQGQLFARYPIESWHLAPYAMVGGGATWANSGSQGNGNVGAGLEYRFNRSVGIFVDSRYIYGSKALNESLSRAGVRFVF